MAIGIVGLINFAIKKAKKMTRAIFFFIERGRGGRRWLLK